MVRATSDSDGDLAISFRSGAGRQPRVWLRHWRRSGSLGPLLAVSPQAHANGFHHALASDQDGDSVVVWTRSLADDRFTVYGRRVSRAGLLGPSVRLGRGDRPDVALDSEGDGLAVWHHPDDDVTDAVHGSAVADASRFSPDRRLADKGRAPQASATRGRIVVSWQQNYHPYRIQAAVNPSG
jgi:hypothetical protein